MYHSAFTDYYWEFFNSLDDDDSITMATAQHARAASALCLAVCTFFDVGGPGPHGFIAGRKANVNREFDIGVQRMMTDYFNETPIYDDKFSPAAFACLGPCLTGSIRMCLLGFFALFRPDGRSGESSSAMYTFDNEPPVPSAALLLPVTVFLPHRSPIGPARPCHFG
jgi:hypothetical protein